MLTMDTWWKEIFSGALAVGINEQKLKQLQDESFLYLQEKSSTYMQHDYIPNEKHLKQPQI